MTPALALAGIRKQFGSVHALRGADFVLLPGELHALLGENGAGKSTLMKVAYGLIRPDAGGIERDGRPVRYDSPLAARRDGIGMVHQHPTSIDALTVAENVALASGWDVSSPAALAARVRALTEKLDLPLDPGARVADLGIALKQRLEIVKALASDATILLLDEPSAVLAPREAEELLARVKRFCAGGGSAVLITHKRREAIEHADRVTVLRAGAVALHAPARDVTEEALGRAMIGTEATPRPAARTAPVPGAVLVRLHGATLAREGGGVPAVTGATLDVAAGEIVAVAAVEGNGQRELLRAVAGLHPVAEGSAQVEGPVAFVPEDRSTEGLIGDATLTENVVLGVGAPAPWRHRWTIDWAAAASATEALVARFRVKAGGAAAAARSLSGGNQQKLLIARALARRPRVLVLENPTRGLDFDATRFVHEQLRAAAAAGAAVLVHSADLDEVLELGDRIVVVANGVVREAPPGADRASVGALMLGGGGPA